MINRSQLGLLLGTLLALLSLVAAEGILNLESSEGYTGLRLCARNCYGSPDGYWVTKKLGCRAPGVGYIPPDNDCWCRPDLQIDAVQYLSSCANTKCSRNALDVASATQVYKDYCTGLGYTVAATTEAVPTATDNQGSNNGNVPKTTGPAGSKPTNDSGAPSDNRIDTEATSGSSAGSGLGIGAIIGIAAGVISAIAAVVGCLIKYKSYKKQKALQRKGQGFQGPASW